MDICLCPKCTEQVVSKLTPNDVYLLHELKDKTTAQTGATRDEVFAKLKDTMSVFQLGQSLMRMEFVGFISSLKSGKTTYYHITQSGIVVLNILSNQ